jgi:ubiquinone/menaquinone biosynthesis C-methylase UbiE
VLKGNREGNRLKITIPDKALLTNTGEVDYYNLYYKFPVSMVFRYRLKKIVDLLGSRKYPVLLEAGTGSGIFLPELSKHCERLYACDIHDKIEHLKKLCDHYNISNCNLSVQNIENTDYESNYFDVVVIMSVLEFVSSPETAVKEIKRILKYNGILLTLCPMENHILDYLLSFYTRKNPCDEFVNSRRRVSRILEENFQILDKGYMFPVFGSLFPVYTWYKLQNCSSCRWPSGCEDSYYS